jgi:hypothetical protein
VKRFFAGVFALTLLASMSSAQQQSPAPGQQKNETTPGNESGKRNPSQKENKRQHSQVSPHNTTTKPANPGDVPHQGPGEQSPDLKQHSTENTTLSTASHRRTKRQRATKHTHSDRTGTQR